METKNEIYNDNAVEVAAENDEAVIADDNTIKRNSMNQSTRFITTNRLKRYDVVNKKGEDMGQVQTFVVDMVTDRIAFVVVSFEGFLGISDKWFAMPLEMLNWSSENKKFILDMSKETLEKAPGMDKNNWPDNINFDMVAKTYNHFGVAPYWDSGEAGAGVVPGVVTPIQVLSSIAITPNAPANVAEGSAVQFTAIGTNSDKSTMNITHKVIWTSSNHMIATLSSKGLAIGVGTGITNITASMPGVISPPVRLRTTAKLTASPFPEKETANA